MGRRYFGTDGIRGRVGQHPVTPDFMLKFGWALGRVLRERQRDLVVIGKDTRISGYMFESALEAGLSAAGVDIRLLGPMPTPAIAYLTTTMRAGAGIVISASHNGHEDNGIKLFSGDGEKFDDETEQSIEDMLELPLACVESGQLGKAARISDAEGRYIEFCKGTVDRRLQLDGLRLVMDCANGATYHVGPQVFSELGAEVTVINSRPDGTNINVACGSTHPQRLQQAVVERGAELGIAFDGDGDRLIMVDAHGAVVDGDELLYILARGRQQAGRLCGPVVGTLMSNLGLELALRELGVGFQRAKVGDRYVLETLKAHRGMLGGESSGHLLCLDRTTTGDGIVSALQVIEILRDSGQSLAEARGGMRKLPQWMINVTLPRGVRYLPSAALDAAVAQAERLLGEQGRVLLRPSGTEPLVRVMVEGADAELVRRQAEAIAAVVDRQLRPMV
jgi:phosphoglucosamine mutase